MKKKSWQNILKIKHTLPRPPPPFNTYIYKKIPAKQKKVKKKVKYKQAKL